MPIDFEATAANDEQAPIDIPRTSAGHIDFEGIADVTEHAAELAKHRWRQKQLQTGAKTDTYPVQAPGGASALAPYGGTGPQRPEGPSVMDQFSQELQPGSSLAGNAVKDAAGLGVGTADMAQLALRPGAGWEKLAPMVKGAAEFGLKAPLASWHRPRRFQ